MQRCERINTPWGMAIADHERQGQAAHEWCKLRTVLEFASGKGHASSTFISTRDSAQNFSVKFSPTVCIAVVASLTGEMAAICRHV